MKVRPLGARLLIKPIQEEKRTEGGIVLPDTAKEKPMKAEVVAVGNLEDSDVDIVVGDKVIFSKYSGTEIKIEDDDYIIIDVEDILAKIED
ncbi:molecular chaperone GroES [Thermosipho melanesiensis]|uniref:Co-chaperonin GroES n=2 Tax=Thermosipho melanesiensis TaxID=46541 RepID=CH10_THEM4|nr:co-chaperone GroES [Thermosipho melanesiensis]A6LJ31.1 RecName: Full=Co-chaperonin GroES; AltName: Full=10 kDa chaperonin; AltName: Full=Chaperonin-10; Short=Cpn10 [Thermosipho melanesiensis BI429]ABR29932.1 chaperonin Cpn10 [Thermosipho melanesiensis BI429]APT73140.1 molecular chaperone GroES [Thermosipho melanesiensis]OOC38536.1 molecular chaperone GroES [Thermosipho melanesiensis]OOC40340.1 molecular chaperone GroES [Thermosipho melanesiensis]OOC40604.1 molecular chaperone GroES [Thermo